MTIKEYLQTVDNKLLQNWIQYICDSWWYGIAQDKNGTYFLNNGTEGIDIKQMCREELQKRMKPVESTEIMDDFI